MDKYGVGQDIYCYPDSDVLINLLDLRDELDLFDAERDLSLLAAEQIDFAAPPYNLAYLQAIHRQLFQDIYPWAGEIRRVDIAKDTTRFCTATRIQAEGDKLFAQLAQQNYFADLALPDLINAAAEFYVELNMLHPFREGNGRSQRILFEHLLLNVGVELHWGYITKAEWVAANIAGVHVDYAPMQAIFQRCIKE
jgi:cell filamentation protein